MSDRRVPVIVGVAQLRRRPELDGPFEPIEPVRLMLEAVRRAAGDAGDPALCEKPDYVGTVPPMAWGYEDAPARLAELLGASPAHRYEPKPGGNSPLELVHHAAAAIARGEARIAVLAGAEAILARQRAAREGLSLDHWSPQPDPPIDTVLRGQPPMTSPLEMRHGIRLPIDIFPLFESALRARAGRSIAEHQAVLGRMLARFSAVAAKNPYAWFPVERSAEEFTTVNASNRWICFPYPKLMNAIITVDMASALVLMSDAEAARRNIPPDRRVALLAGASANDPWWLTERPDFAHSPGCAAAASAALSHAGIGVEDVDLFDLYSCFPSAVQLGADALGLALDDPRPLTVTGGLPCAGGPGNSYAMHSIAAMIDRLRAGDARVGCVSGLGMSASKHAVSVFSADPARVAAADGETPHVELPAEARSGPEIVDAPEGPGTIETYTVVFDRENCPQTSRLIVRLDDGRRTVAHGEPTPAAFARLIESEGVGLRGVVRPGHVGEPNRFELE